jgi:hypothetical protein
LILFRALTSSRLNNPLIDGSPALRVHSGSFASFSTASDDVGSCPNNDQRATWHDCRNGAIATFCTAENQPVLVVGPAWLQTCREATDTRADDRQVRFKIKEPGSPEGARDLKLGVSWGLRLRSGSAEQVGRASQPGPAPSSTPAPTVEAYSRNIRQT